MLKSIDFFISGKSVSFNDICSIERTFGNSSRELDYVEGLFKSLGPYYDIYYYRAHHTILSKFNFTAVKVIVPKLVPMYLYELNIPVGANRLRSVLNKLGYTPIKVLNKVPHPFP